MIPRTFLLAALLATLCGCQSPAVVKDSPIQACFKNDTGRQVLLWFWTGWEGYGGFEETWFELSPRDSVSVILKGSINVATATNKSAKIALKRNLPAQGPSRFYDAQR